MKQNSVQTQVNRKWEVTLSRQTTSVDKNQPSLALPEKELSVVLLCILNLAIFDNEFSQDKNRATVTYSWHMAR